MIDRDRGSVAIEVAILAPALLGFLVFVVILGRVSLAKQAVDQAAFDAARTASLARDSGTARSTADAAAAGSLASLGLSCRGIRVSVDTGGFRRPVGQPATVTATVSCRADLSDIALPGMPGSKSITATFESPLDTYRGRTLGFGITQAPTAANPSTGGA